MAQAKIGNSIKRVVVVVVHRLLLLTTTDWQQHQAHRSRGHRLGGQSGSRGLVRTLARASDGLPGAPVKAPAAEWMTPTRGAGEGTRRWRVSEEARARSWERWVKSDKKGRYRCVRRSGMGRAERAPHVAGDCGAGQVRVELGEERGGGKGWDSS